MYFEIQVLLNCINHCSHVLAVTENEMISFLKSMFVNMHVPESLSNRTKLHFDSGSMSSLSDKYYEDIISYYLYLYYSYICKCTIIWFDIIASSPQITEVRQLIYTHLTTAAYKVKVYRREMSSKLSGLAEICSTCGMEVKDFYQHASFATKMSSRVNFMLKSRIL